MSEREGDGAVLFDRIPRAAVGCRWMAHDYRTESRPRWETSFPAQAQVAAWSAGRAESERVDGPFSALGRIAAWSAERAERERADGPVFASGRMAAWCAERRMRERAVGCFRIRAEFQL
jgi:hypothetical protein